MTTETITTPLTYTVRDAAAILGVSRQQVHYLCQRGILTAVPSTDLPARRLITGESVERRLQAPRSRGGRPKREVAR